MIKTSEHVEQATFIDTVLWQYRSREDFIRPLLFAVPNGAYLGGNRPAVMNKLKKEGFRNGVSDVIYAQARGEYGYLALELKTIERKRSRDGGLSEDQAEFLRSVSLGGGLAAVCYGAEEAIEAFSRYMALPIRVILPAP